MNCTGSNIYGQLGIGSTINSNQFTQVTDKVALINAGAQHSVIMKTDGSFWTAGYNDSGQLGLGTTGSNITSFTKVNMP